MRGKFGASLNKTRFFLSGNRMEWNGSRIERLHIEWIGQEGPAGGCSRTDGRKKYRVLYKVEKMVRCGKK